MSETGSAWMLLILAVCIYFAPLVVAVTRERHNAGAIAALNVFLGWTLVGWVVALVWALSSPLAAPRVDR